jgi:hypothetical protein
MLHYQELAQLSQTDLFDGELLHCLLCYMLSAFHSPCRAADELADFNGFILHLLALRCMVRNDQPHRRQRTHHVRRLDLGYECVSCTLRNIWGTTMGFPPSCLCVSDFSLAMVTDFDETAQV